MSYLVAAWNRTPAHVVHLSNGVIETEFLILSKCLLVKVEVLDVEVVHHFLATLAGALELRHLAIIDLL